MPQAQHPTWPVAISTSNGATGATLVWHRQGKLYVTAVVKATFALVPGGAMTRLPPEPIAIDEQQLAAGLRTAGDLVPFRRRVDVTITGHAVVPPGPRGAGVPVRFSVMRDGVAVLDKSASLRVPEGGPADRVWLSGFGPLSRHWPIRSRLLGAHDPRLFEGAAIELPPVFDESYFQAAPLDQRLDSLRGDERIVFEGARLEGTRIDGARIESRLPGVRAIADLHGPAASGDPQPLDLAIDTLHLDLDQSVCTVTWRGVSPVAREADLGSLRVVATVELSKASLAPEAPLVAASEEKEDDEPHPFESTFWFSPATLQRRVAELPAQPSPPPAATPAPAAAPVEWPTMLLSAELATAPSFESATPAPYESTLALSDEDVARLHAALATPFVAVAPTAPASAAPAAPFLWQEREGSPSGWKMPSAPPLPLQGVAGAEEAEESRVEIAPVAAAEVAPVAPVWLGPRGGAESAQGMTFGAHFLAAMELFEGMHDQA